MYILITHVQEQCQCAGCHRTCTGVWYNIQYTIHYTHCLLIGNLSLIAVDSRATFYMIECKCSIDMWADVR